MIFLFIDKNAFKILSFEVDARCPAFHELYEDPWKASTSDRFGSVFKRGLNFYRDEFNIVAITLLRDECFNLNHVRETNDGLRSIKIRKLFIAVTPTCKTSHPLIVYLVILKIYEEQ